MLYAIFASMYVLKQARGTERMIEIQEYIKEGARAYLKKQYVTIWAVMAVLTVLIGLFLSWYTALAYVVGGLCSMISGFVGMTIAVNANARTANAAKEIGLDKALRIAFSGGSVLGMSVVGLGLLGVTLLFVAYGKAIPHLEEAAHAVAGFAFGASTVALFARVGGGIYTKAADVGADLVGKVEKGIPEDDPRNPGVIADNVGDNVGDVAGMGADLFESYVEDRVAALILGALLFLRHGNFGWVTTPLVVSAVGIFASIVGAFFVRGNPWRAFSYATYVTTILTAVLSYFVCMWLIPEAGLYVWISIVAGLIVGIIVGTTSDYFTNRDKRPVKIVAESSVAGPALTILSGFSIGWLSTFLPAIGVAIVSLASFVAGSHFTPDPILAGFYCVVMAVVSMLAIVGIIVAADAYGPVADNAAGIAEQAHLEPRVRQITDTLDSVGNTMKSICKGFAIGGAALTALALLATYAFSIEVYGAKLDLSLLNARTLAGLVIGVSIPALFTSVVVYGVTKSAFTTVEEIRRQFKEIKGLFEGTAKPEYGRCVSIVTHHALRWLIPPGVMAIASPLIVGFTLGPDGLGGFLAGAIAMGLILGLFQGNVGNTWDNAKKYVEMGHLGGKGSPTHAATVIGDTVGDPMKDSSGPSVNILIKLMAMTALIFVPLIVRYALP